MDIFEGHFVNFQRKKLLLCEACRSLLCLLFGPSITTTKQSQFLGKPAGFKSTNEEYCLVLVFRTFLQWEFRFWYAEAKLGMLTRFSLIVSTQ